MDCLFQKQPRTMATGWHITKYKQSDPRSRDIGDNRTKAPRKNVAEVIEGEEEFVQRAEAFWRGSVAGRWAQPVPHPERWEGAAPGPLSSRRDFDFPVGRSWGLWSGAHQPRRRAKGLASFDLCWNNLKLKVGNFISADLLIKLKNPTMLISLAIPWS